MHRSGVAMAWNVFKFCTALRGLGSIMILLVLGIVGITYYAVVVTNYGPALLAGGGGSGSLEGALAAALVLVLFHGLLAMLLWSYFSVVFTDPGGVPPNWRPSTDEESGDAVPLTSSDYGNGILSLQQSAGPADQLNARIRYCRKCNQMKPPRCHHCSVCGRCVLKMDHHCVWVVNCVGALNYKFFLLFLFYTFLETTLVTLSLLPQFLAFFGDGEIIGTPGMLATTFLAFVLNLAFALSVLGFMIMHMSLVAGNTTTIEAYEKKLHQNGDMTLAGKRILNRYLGQTRSTGSPLYTRKRTCERCLLSRALTIHADLNLKHKIFDNQENLLFIMSNVGRPSADRPTDAHSKPPWQVLIDHEAMRLIMKPH